MTSDDTITPAMLDNIDNLNHPSSSDSSPADRLGHSSSPPMPPSTQKRTVSTPVYAYNPAHTSVHNPAQNSAHPSMRPSSPDSSIAELIGTPFSEFDHSKEIIEPFSEETTRDMEFQEELTSMLLDALIETHAWSTARTKQDNIGAAERFEHAISRIMDAHKVQGTSSLSLTSAPMSSLAYALEKTRERLNEFIVKITNAIVALTGAMMF